MPNARQALYLLAQAGDTWPGQRDDWASPASGGIRMSPPLGQKPVMYLQLTGNSSRLKTW